MYQIKSSLYSIDNSEGTTEKIRWYRIFTFSRLFVRMPEVKTSSNSLLNGKNTLHKLKTLLPVIYSNHLTSKTKKCKFCLQKRVRIKITKSWTILWQSRVEWLEWQPLGPMNHHEHVIKTPGCINNDETTIWQPWWTAMVVKTYTHFSPFNGLLFLNLIKQKIA